MRAALLALLFALHSCSALDNGLALRPPMGVNTWNVSSTRTLVSTSLLLHARHAPRCLRALCRVLIAPRRLHPQAFHDEINETLVKETADLLVTLGLKDAGYDFVNLDGARSLGCCFPAPTHTRRPQGSSLCGPRRRLGAEGAQWLAAHQLQCHPLPQRHQGAGGVRACQGAQTGHLQRQRQPNVRGVHRIPRL